MAVVLLRCPMMRDADTLTKELPANAYTPLPAGTMLMLCLGSKRLISGIHAAGYPLSFWSQFRKMPVIRGAMPSTVAPGRSLAMTRSHAETG